MGSKYVFGQDWNLSLSKLVEMVNCTPSDCPKSKFAQFLSSNLAKIDLLHPLVWGTAGTV